MKKMLSFVLVLALLCTVSLSFAADGDNVVTEDAFDGTTEYVVSTTVTIDTSDLFDSFIVTIPATVTIDPETLNGSATLMVSKGFQLKTIDTLKIRLQSAYNGVKDELYAFTMKGVDANGNEIECPYAIYDATNCRYLSEGSHYVSSTERWEDYTMYDLLNVGRYSYAEEDKIVELSFRVPAQPERGTYSDTLNFVIITE